MCRYSEAVRVNLIDRSNLIPVCFVSLISSFSNYQVQYFSSMRHDEAPVDPLLP